MADIHVSRAVLHDLKVKALRRRVWFKLSLEERSLIDLTCRVVDRVKSKILKIALINVVSKLNSLLTNNFLEKIHDLGSMIANRYVSYALKWGYGKAAKWINDEAYIFHLGLTWINTPPTYRYETLKAEYIIILDADRDIDAGNIKKYIEALEKYDVVIGSKRHPHSTYQAPLLRKMLSLGFNILVKIMLGVRISDTQTGFKAFKAKYLKTIMKAIVVKRYSWDAEVLALANLLKLKIAEAPVHIKQERLFKIRDALKMLLELLGITYRLRMIRWYQRNLERRPELQTTLKI